MRNEEAPAVAAVHNRAYAPWISSLPPVYRQSEIQAGDVRRWPGRVLVAVAAEGVVGYTRAERWPDGEIGFGSTDEHAGQSQIAVLPGFRRRGIGGALVRVAAHTPGGSPPAWVHACAYSDNVEATAFLSSLGFRTGRLDESCPGCEVAGQRSFWWQSLRVGSWDQWSSGPGAFWGSPACFPRSDVAASARPSLLELSPP